MLIVLYLLTSDKAFICQYRLSKSWGLQPRKVFDEGMGHARERTGEWVVTVAALFRSEEVMVLSRRALRAIEYWKALPHHLIKKYPV